MGLENGEMEERFDEQISGLLGDYPVRVDEGVTLGNKVFIKRPSLEKTIIPLGTPPAIWEKLFSSQENISKIFIRDETIFHIASQLLDVQTIRKLTHGILLAHLVYPDFRASWNTKIKEKSGEETAAQQKQTIVEWCEYLISKHISPNNPKILYPPAFQKGTPIRELSKKTVSEEDYLPEGLSYPDIIETVEQIRGCVADVFEEFGLKVIMPWATHPLSTVIWHKLRRGISQPDDRSPLDGMKLQPNGIIGPEIEERHPFICLEKSSYAPTSYRPLDIEVCVISAYRPKEQTLHNTDILKPNEFGVIIARVLHVLKALREKEIIWGDLKPRNVFWTGQCFDFSQSSTLKDSDSHQVTRAVTWAYSPADFFSNLTTDGLEGFHYEFRFIHDLFALGCTILELYSKFNCSLENNRPYIYRWKSWVANNQLDQDLSFEVVIEQFQEFLSEEMKHIGLPKGLRSVVLELMDLQKKDEWERDISSLIEQVMKTFNINQDDIYGEGVLPLLK